MAKTPKVSLMVKCKVNGKWKNLPVQIAANGRIKVIPGGTFYLRYNRNQWEPVGKDPDAAMAAKRRREISLEGITGVSVTDGDSRRTIVGAIAQYLADTAVSEGAQDTRCLPDCPEPIP